MGVKDLFRRFGASAAPERPAEAVDLPAPERVQASAQGKQFSGLDDPELLEYMRNGAGTASGEYVTAHNALRNMAVLRSVSLYAESIGMLPVNLVEKGDAKKIATAHPAHRLLKVKPNTWQTPYEFKSQMEANVMVHGRAYARVIRSRGRPLYLIPLDPQRVTPELTDDWTMVYKWQRKDGGQIELAASDVLHLRDLSLDGIEGMSRVKLAGEAIGLALQAEKAAARLFRNGVMAGGAISAPNQLSDKAYKNINDSLESKYAGAGNAHKWMVLEEGMKAEKWTNTASDDQHIENRNHQIQEVARAFGIPRPLLMMDDTSWGSGIEQLGIFFIVYGLQHRFTSWEQATGRVLLDESEQDNVHFKFNERALLRGTLKDQADFFAKASGAGGHAPWMSQNEVREVSDLPRSLDPAADRLRNPMTQPSKPNEPPATP